MNSWNAIVVCYAKSEMGGTDGVGMDGKCVARVHAHAHDYADGSGCACTHPARLDLHVYSRMSASACAWIYACNRPRQVEIRFQGP